MLFSLFPSRYLLCGQEVVPGESGGRRLSTGSAGAIGFTGPSSLGSSGPSSFDGNPPAAVTRAIQTMSITDFTDMVACFMRVSWAAAAGRLFLASTTQSFKEGSSIYSTGNSSANRHTSTGI